MIPLFIQEIAQTSNFDFQKNKIEYVQTTTTIEFGKKIHYFLDNGLDIQMRTNPFTNLIGTTISFKLPDSNPSFEKDTVGFYNDNYELEIEKVKFNSVFRKVKVKSVVKFTPRIVL